VKKMGGIGSGRRYQGGKETTDQMRMLDIRRLHRDGLWEAGRWLTVTWSNQGEVVASIQIRAEADHVLLKYLSRRHGDAWQPMEYPVHLTWTDCHMGGRRALFLCPAKECGRRVAILYGGSTFACRHCHRLAYACQRETEDDRAVRRADRIRQRLGWTPGILNENGSKPKGMHWRTFERLTSEHDAFSEAALAGIVRRFEIPT
jgi:hypothetical protein